MHNGLSIYQTKTTFLALQCLSYILFNRLVVGKHHCYAWSRNKPTIITELQPTLQKHIYICCSFNKVSMKRKNTLRQENFDLTIDFDLMINFDFFYLKTWDSLMVWAWHLVCGRFMNFQNGRKILTLLTFGCPTNNIRQELSSFARHKASEREAALFSKYSKVSKMVLD